MPAGYLDEILNNASLAPEIRAQALSRSEGDVVSLGLLKSALESEEPAFFKKPLSFFLMSQRKPGGDSMFS